MGGIFGLCLDSPCVTDLFFGTDYHSHLGPRRGGIAVFDGTRYTRAIHNIENSPFRTKFEDDLADMHGNIGIGCISDSHPQPIIMSTRIGTFGVVMVGRINNKDVLTRQLVSTNTAYFTEMSDGTINDTELVSALICTKDSIAEGIKYAQEVIEGSVTMLVSADGGIYASRDKMGRTPLFIGKKVGSSSGYCASMESFAYINLGYKTCHELGPGEIVFITDNKITMLQAPRKEMKMCTFLWLYYGFPTSDYEGINAETMRYKCGASMARQDIACSSAVDVDYVAGIPDSGTPHAIGYANQARIPFARPLIKYTPTWPRSFTPKDQSVRHLIAKMKLIPIDSLIQNKRLLFIDDSIVRGTQLSGMMEALSDLGAKELHGRIGGPPILFNCKYLNFTRSSKESENIARRSICDLEGGEVSPQRLSEYTEFGSRCYRNLVDDVRKKLNFDTLEYHSLDGMLDSVGVEKCKLCTYCWNGKE